MQSDGKIERYEPARIERRVPPADPDTVEMERAPELVAYWNVLRKRRWTVLTIFFVLFTLVLLGTLKQRPVYRATALLEIQKENANILTMKELFELETVTDTYLETQYKIFKSDTLAKRVIQQLHIDTLEEFNPRNKSRESADQVVLARFEDRLGIDPVKRSRLVEVTFESYDPQLAARAVNALAENYIQQNLEVRWEATQKASEWLAQQLVGMKAKLEKSEDELQAYVRENGLLFLETEKGGRENIVDERLRQLQEELTKAESLRYEKESLVRQAESGDASALPGLADNKLLQDLTVKLADLKRERALLVTTFSPGYLKVRQVQSQIDEIDAVLAREHRRAAERVKNDYAVALHREALVRKSWQDQQREAHAVAERTVQYNILRREVGANRELYEGLLSRLKEAGVSAGLKSSNIRIVDAAEPPKKPARPNFPLNLSLGILMGLGFGVGAAFLLEHLDNTLKSAEDVERFLQVPALALIPSAQSLNGNGRGVYGLAQKNSSKKQLPADTNGTPRPAWFRIDADGQHGTFTEAFRGLRTSVLLSTAERAPRSLLVTSARPGEGKTTVSINLAISLAQLGPGVLLIDGDLRRPSVHRAFGLENSGGLVRYLTGGQDWRGVAAPTGLAGLDVILSGPMPPNPAELLSSERMRQLVREATREYRCVIIDSPPLLNVADSRILATMVEGLILVVEGGNTPRDLAQRAQACARHVGAAVIGVVLNNLDLRADGGYYYRYYRDDYYSSTPQGAPLEENGTAAKAAKAGNTN